MGDSKGMPAQPTMPRVNRWILALCVPLVRWVLSLRYRVELRGVAELTAALTKGKGVLVLPNHPAEIDPVIIVVWLHPWVQLQPVVLEKFYDLNPVVAWVMRKIGAIPMPDMAFDTGPAKRRRVNHALTTATAVLAQKGAVLLYPSGRLTDDGTERLGGNTGAFTLARQAAPEVLLVRTRGIFGSSFSKAQTAGITPDLPLMVLRAIWTLLTNGLFFTPRRSVSIEIIPAPQTMAAAPTALEFNNELRQVLHAPEIEKPTAIPERWYSRRAPEIKLRPILTVHAEEADPTLVQLITKKIAAVVSQPEEKITLQSRLSEDLGLDSLAVADIVVWLDREFDLPEVDLAAISTVGSLIEAVMAKSSQVVAPVQVQPPFQWQSPQRAPQIDQSAETILHALWGLQERDPFLLLCADMRVPRGLTTRALTVRALALAHQIAQMPGDKIGILLPASVATTVTLVAVLLAGKTPVMLNWTAGQGSLRTAVEACALQRIICSAAFLDAVMVDLQEFEHLFVTLEELASGISLRVKMRAWRLARQSLESVLAALGSSGSVHGQSLAAVLFTSGSESTPKGVPLTHHNILTNLRDVFSLLPLQSRDVLFAFLPPFHSFGLAVGVVAPLISGLQVAYAANPTESRKLAQAIPHWQASIVAGTPTFINGMLQVASREMLASLRLLVTGAEKTPASLYHKVREMTDAKIVEGYGITECSPVVTLSEPSASANNGGRILAHEEVLVVHPELHQPLPDGEQGLVLVRGDNVFAGYLTASQDPFVTVAGKRFYNTGDLGIMQGGTLTITGRLKRFVKIAGEMVSLGAAELILSEAFPAPDDRPHLAVVAKGAEGQERPRLILLSTLPIDREAACQALLARGFPPVGQISEVRKIDEIPILGTGKVDWRALARLV